MKHSKKIKERNRREMWADYIKLPKTMFASFEEYCKAIIEMRTDGLGTPIREGILPFNKKDVRKEIKRMLIK